MDWIVLVWYKLLSYVMRLTIKIIYGWPMVYSLSPKVRNLFVNLDPVKDFYPPKEGINTGDNEKFVKFWWEILERPDISKSRYKPFIKGGETKKYYGSINNLIRWDESEIKKLSGSAIRNKDSFFKEAVTFISLSSSGFAAKYTPPGCLFCSTGGRSVFPESTRIPYLLAFLNSKLAEFLLQTINPTLSFTVGDVGRLPFKLPGLIEQKISNLSNNCMLLKKFHLQFAINDREFKQTAIQWGYDKSVRNMEINK